MEIGLDLLRPLLRHESFFGHRLALKAYRRRLRRKIRFLWKILRSSPFIPGLAILGAFISDGNRIYFLLIYLAAVAMPYFFQAAHVWYYTIPLLPPCAILAAFGVGWLSDQGISGLALIFLLGLVWLGVHLAQSYGRLVLRGVASLNLYTVYVEAAWD